MDLPEAYGDDNLAQILDANDSVPEWFSGEAVQHAVDYAKHRASARGEDSALEDTETECLITTNWSSFTDDWGHDDGANEVALGILNERVSATTDAMLFNDTDILQTGWLQSGDGRRTQAERYVDKEFGGDDGEMWVPKNAAQYLCIIKLDDELIHGDVQMVEAM